ncbi:hypothetical protein QUW55_14220, partial [Phocaeicola barnesiae]|uniref:hypothetical protein n=1 Tax=Phocaeicola barnesiae TaxID=376804 RepID=UPI0025A3235B
NLDGASSFHPYHILLIWTTSCTTSLFVYLKLFKELASVFRKRCKGTDFSEIHKLHAKLFSNFFRQ